MERNLLIKIYTNRVTTGCRRIWIISQSASIVESWKPLRSLAPTATQIENPNRFPGRSTVSFLAIRFQTWENTCWLETLDNLPSRKAGVFGENVVTHQTLLWTLKRGYISRG
jgi:hypothetical protein